MDEKLKAMIKEWQRLDNLYSKSFEVDATRLHNFEKGLIPLLISRIEELEEKVSAKQEEKPSEQETYAEYLRRKALEQEAAKKLTTDDNWRLYFVVVDFMDGTRVVNFAPVKCDGYNMAKRGAKHTTKMICKHPGWYNLVPPLEHYIPNDFKWAVYYSPADREPIMKSKNWK
jgi:hypothetical protein